MRTSTALLLATALLTSFLSGIGFLNFMGFNPAMRETPPKELVTYWQSLDGYMKVRMPIFGMILLALFITTGIVLLRQSFKLPFVFIALSCAFVLVDLWITTRFNFPFNRMVQSITAETIPDNFEELRTNAAFGFNLRSICMLGSFITTLSALFFHFSRSLLR